MNNDLFQQARLAYAQKDYEGALASYTQCLQEAGDSLEPGETGRLYHQIGNCLVKLKNHTEAIQAYTQAAADTAYDACGAVNCNLGMSYAAMHDYENAVRHFEIAVSDAKYGSAYKAYTGLGSSLLKLGKSAEAGVAFREAALDEANPDPTKALLNLGICFMALDRAADAVASYESALQFDMTDTTRNRLYANLGQAYVACGQMQKAAAAFEQALADKTYFLSDSASVDYQRAVAALSQGTAEITQVISPVASEQAEVDTSGLDVVADGSAPYVDQDPYAGQQQDAYQFADPYAEQGEAYSSSDDDDDRFFTATDEELEQWSRGLMQQGHKPRRTGLKIAIVVVLIVLLLLGGAAFMYTQGWGYPTQEGVVKQLFADPQSAASTVVSKDFDQSSATSMVEPVVQDEDITINGVEKSMNESVVYVTANTPEGGDIQYKITLARDLVGWKVSGIDLYFSSQE